MASKDTYCEVSNPTWHLQPFLDSCKVSQYVGLSYDEIIAAKEKKKKLGSLIADSSIVASEQTYSYTPKIKSALLNYSETMNGRLMTTATTRGIMTTMA